MKKSGKKTHENKKKFQELQKNLQSAPGKNVGKSYLLTTSEWIAVKVTKNPSGWCSGASNSKRF